MGMEKEEEASAKGKGRIDDQQGKKKHSHLKSFAASGRRKKGELIEKISTTAKAETHDSLSFPPL